MKKKICIALVLCFTISLISGCGAKKLQPFDMTAADLNESINESIVKLDYYSVTVPEFVEEKDNTYKKKDYTCDVSDNLSVSIVQYSTDGTYYIIVIMMFPLYESDSEMVETFKEFLSVTYGIVTAVDPDADFSKIMNGLQMNSLTDSTLTYKTDNYNYESYTSIASKTFSVTKK